MKQKRFLMVKTSLEHISKLILVGERQKAMTNAHKRIQAQQSTFFKIALNRVLTRSNARSRREFFKSSGIIEIENKSISVVTNKTLKKT